MAKLVGVLKKELGAQNVNTCKELTKELTSSDAVPTSSKPPPPVAGISSTS
jgi:hypothetical protein